MGNNNSTHDETKSPSEEKDIFEQLFSQTETMFPDTKTSTKKRDTTSPVKKNKSAEDILSKQVYNRVDDMYNRLWLQKQPYENKQIDTTLKKYKLPYTSETNYDKQISLSSDDPHQYIEFIVCQGDLNKVNKKYPINLTKPGHHCNSECGCVMQLLEVYGDKIELYDEQQSLSVTSPEFRNIFFKQDQSPKKLMFGGRKENDDDSIFSATSEENNSEVSKKKEKSKKEENESEDDIFDEPDEENEDLEGLEEEDITEDGFLIEQSDLNSSDLYRMQRRIFVSETETPSQLTSDETTEKVRNAINKLNVRNSMFNSEDRKILDLNSDTDKYYSRPAKRNTKYN